MSNDKEVTNPFDFDRVSHSLPQDFVKATESALAALIGQNASAVGSSWSLHVRDVSGNLDPNGVNPYQLADALMGLIRKAR